MSEDLRYPIEDFDQDVTVTPEMREKFINTLIEHPAKLREAVDGLNEEQMQTPYRPGGWTVHQVVHHVADSHMNAFIRFKLGLTEDNPTIKPYLEAAWAELADTTQVPINMSLTLLHSLHA